MSCSITMTKVKFLCGVFLRMKCNFSEEMEETILEPIVKVKEEEMERKYHECNEFFSAGKKKVLI